MTGILPETLTFTHSSQPIVAVLVKNAPGAGVWTIIETCTICNQPLAHYPFYATEPLVFYIHAHCIYDCAALAATAAPPIGTTSSTSSSTQRGLASQSRNIPFYTPHYPSYITNPSYSPSTAYPPTTYYPPSSPYYYNQYPPPYHHNQYPAPYHHNQYPPPYYHNQYPPPYYHNQYQHPLQNTHHPSSSSSSVAGWTKIMSTTVVGSFMQALFSLLLSES